MKYITYIAYSIKMGCTKQRQYLPLGNFLISDLHLMIFFLQLTHYSIEILV